MGVGYCLESCLGELLNVPEDSFPFYQDSDWSQKLNEYLIKKHSVYLIGINQDCKSETRGSVIAVWINKDGKTKQERTHAVIMDGDDILLDTSHGTWFKVEGRKLIDYFLVLVNFYDMNFLKNRG